MCFKLMVAISLDKLQIDQGVCQVKTASNLEKRITVEIGLVYIQ